jgi:hypothetical protein
VKLAALAGLDPWGPYWARDFVAAYEARRLADRERDACLVAMIGNLFAQKPKSLAAFMPGAETEKKERPHGKPDQSRQGLRRNRRG